MVLNQHKHRHSKDQENYDHWEKQTPRLSKCTIESSSLSCVRFGWKKKEENKKGKKKKKIKS